MAAEKDPLDSYIRFLVDQRDKRSQQLSDEEMRRIALEMGLSEADLAQAEQTAREHRDRASSFMVHGRFQDAVEELKAAAPFLPGDLQLHLQLARCYLALSDAEQAEHWARYCLQLDPRSNDAVQLLNEIDAVGRNQQHWDRQGRRSAVSAFFGAMGAVVVLVAIIVAVVLRSGTATTPTTVPPVKSVTTPSPTKNLPGFTQKHRDIPVSLVGGEQLALERVFSRLSTYNDQSYYKMTAILKNTGTDDVVDLRGSMVLKNEAGVVVKRQALSPFRKSRGKRLLPNEKLGLGTTIIADTTITQADWVLEVADRQPHAQLQEPEPVTVQWAMKQPAFAKLSVSQRTVAGMDMRNNRQSLRLSLDFTNESTSPYNRVKFELDILDAQGKLLLSRPGYVVTDSTPPLLGGETRAFHGVYVYEGQRAAYHLRIVQLE